MKGLRLLIVSAALAFFGLASVPVNACPNCEKGKCPCAKEGKKCGCGDKCTCGKKAQTKPNKK